MQLLNFFKTQPDDRKILGQAQTNFRAFVEEGGRPTYWAHYHIACILSIYPNGQKQNVRDELSSTFRELNNSKSPNADLHRKLLRQLLIGSYDRDAGYPAFCPQLRDFVAANGLPENASW